VPLLILVREEVLVTCSRDDGVVDIVHITLGGTFSMHDRQSRRIKARQFNLTHTLSHGFLVLYT
jgi:hypothetical protein